ncbi:hypothetical protein Tco_1044232 [Tanacetum coccineum]|uniref:Uncharacterized protein n=1 Tax=Tanacetum coccineum TaxID=301880 RepID=A0ABQ5GPB4_9ASTR
MECLVTRLDMVLEFWKYMAMVVVHGGESGGDMVVSDGLKGCLDHWIQGSSPLLPPLQSDLEISEFRSRGRLNQLKRSSYDRVMAKTVNRCREAFSLS